MAKIFNTLFVTLLFLSAASAMAANQLTFINGQLPEAQDPLKELELVNDSTVPVILETLKVQSGYNNDRIPPPTKSIFDRNGKPNQKMMVYCLRLLEEKPDAAGVTCILKVLHFAAPSFSDVHENLPWLPGCCNRVIAMDKIASYCWPLFTERTHTLMQRTLLLHTCAQIL